jgi:hypothetical protein
MDREPPVRDDVLEALAAGEVGEAEAVLLRARLERDPALRARFEAVSRVEAALRAQAEAPLPLNLVAAVVERLGEPAFATEGDAPPARRPRRALVAAAAGALLALGGGAVLRQAEALPTPLSGSFGRPVGPVGDVVAGEVRRAAEAWTTTSVRSKVGVSASHGAGALGVAALAQALGLAAIAARRKRGESRAAEGGS